MRRRKLGVKRLREIAGGYSAIHDVETVPMAEEVLELRAELEREKPGVIDLTTPKFAVWLTSRGWLVDTDGSEVRFAERLTSATTFATEDEAAVALQAACRLDRYADSDSDVGSVVTL